jgi:hypothetical protein
MAGSDMAECGRSAVILCPSSGELDDEGHPFCLLRGPGDGENGCIECKGAGYMFVGL